MEGIYLLLAVIFLGTMIYVLISAKINQLVDNRLREFYETTIKRDMQDFYREMESYTSMLEGRVSQMKKLLDRQEQNTHRFESSVHLAKQVNPQGESAQFLSRLNEIGVPKENLDSLSASQQHSPEPLEKTQLDEQPGEELPDIQQPNSQPQPAAQNVLFESMSVPSYSSTRQPAPPVQANEKISDSELDELLESTVTPDEVTKEEPKPAAAKNTPVDPEVSQQPGPSNTDGQPWVLEPVRKLGKSIATVFNMNGAVPVAGSVQRPEIPAASFQQQLNENVVIVPEPPKAEPSQASGVANAGFLKELQENLGSEQKEPETPILEQQSQSVPLEKSVTDDQPSEPQKLAKDFDPQQFMLLISQIRRRENRREALGQLLEQNIPLDKIAELTNVSIGELEVLRSVHRL